jgi:hypothetical protein
MLNGADGYRGGEGEASDRVKDVDALFSKLKRQVKPDYNSKGQVRTAASAFVTDPRQV